MEDKSDSSDIDEQDPGMRFDGNTPSLENSDGHAEPEIPLMEEDGQSAAAAAASISKGDQPAADRHLKKDVPTTDREADNENTPSTGEANDNSTANANTKTGRIGEQTAEVNPQIATAQSSSAAQESCSQVKPRSSVKRISRFAVIVMIAVGAVFYINPSLIGLNKSQPTTKPVSGVTTEIVTPVQQEITAPPSPSMRDLCRAKLDEALGFRGQLLEKKNEIHQLDLYYRNGITELAQEILREIERAGISTFQTAMEHKRIELNLRTIQRRRAYIEELRKPVNWLHSGSEELYYLVRKAELDLQLNDIAGGIDLNKHLQHISAAIQKYHPSPDRLAIDPLKIELEPLRKIWELVGQSNSVVAQQTFNPQDDIIANEICQGNYERIAELVSITPRVATCLARMNGSDLFLNGVKTLSVDAAKRLFQWRGNWICLNGVTDLSAAAAKYVFSWKGNWISLNSLRGFPPELAKYLLKWEGQQLELMGLEYAGNEVEQKMLKYLALWETTGGKLFVPEKIRREINRMM